MITIVITNTIIRTFNVRIFKKSSSCVKKIPQGLVLFVHENIDEICKNCKQTNLNGYKGQEDALAKRSWSQYV